MVGKRNYDEIRKTSVTIAFLDDKGPHYLQKGIAPRSDYPPSRPAGDARTHSDVSIGIETFQRPKTRIQT